MKIHHDAADRTRIIVLGLEDDEAGLPAFDPRTKPGAYLADLLGSPVSEHYATANIIDDRIASRRFHARDALAAIDGRRVIAVGREVCMLLGVPSSPLMQWQRSENESVFGVVRSQFTYAPFPVPTERSGYWKDLESAERALMWFATQHEYKRVQRDGTRR